MSAKKIKGPQQEVTPMLEMFRKAKKLSPEEGKRVAEKFKSVLLKPSSSWIKLNNE